MNLDQASESGAEGSRPAVHVYAGDARPTEETGLDCVRRFVTGDVYVRARRARGDSVSFGLGVQASGRAFEVEAAKREVPVEELVDRYCDKVSGRLKALNVSCDWSRTVVSSDLEQCRRLQRIFLELLENDLVYHRGPEAWDPVGGRWLFHSRRDAERYEQSLDRLPGWTGTAIEAQHAALGRVAGIEVDATLLGVGEFAVFTPHTDAISEAAFVSVSPRHSSFAGALPASVTEALRRSSSDVPSAQTELQAAVPGVESLLPVVVTPSVETRFGATGTLGIPSRDDVDREIAKDLRVSGGLPVRSGHTGGEPRPVAKYRLADMPISETGGWGAAVPIVHCPDCGIVPVPVAELPLRASGEALASECPKCGGAATRDGGTLGPNFASMWMWWLLMPTEDLLPSGAGGIGEGPLGRAIASAGDGARLLHQRLARGAMGNLGNADTDAGEPFSAASVLGSVKVPEHEEEGSVRSIEELDELSESVGPDVLRFAILHSSAPATSSSWPNHSIRHAERFIGELRDFAEPRLRSCGQPVPSEIDRSTRLRRRLAAWCRIADAKIGSDLDDLQTHRATHNLIRLLERIEDFESRCESHGELSGEDHDAIVVALMQLLRLASPCIPNVAGDLEALAGSDQAPSAVGKANEG